MIDKVTRAVLFGGPADGVVGPILQNISVIVVPHFDGSILYYEPSFTDAGKLATDSEGRVIYRYRGMDRPEAQSVP